MIREPKPATTRRCQYPGSMRQTWLHSIVCAWAAATMITGGCRTPAAVVQRPAPTPAKAALAAPTAPMVRPLVPLQLAEEDGKLVTTLGEAGAAPVNGEVSTLSPAETQSLLAQLEPLPALD